jgi:ferredoxin
MPSASARPRQTPSPSPPPAARRLAAQVSPQDCTGCELCVHACPDNALTSTPIAGVLEAENANWDFMRALPERWGFWGVCSEGVLRGPRARGPRAAARVHPAGRAGEAGRAAGSL